MKLCIVRVSQSFPDLKADRTDTTPKQPKMGRPLKDPKKSIPKHTKALVWRHFSDNEDGETLRCQLWTAYN